MIMRKDFSEWHRVRSNIPLQELSWSGAKAGAQKAAAWGKQNLIDRGPLNRAGKWAKDKWDGPKDINAMYSDPEFQQIVTQFKTELGLPTNDVHIIRSLTNIAFARLYPKNTAIQVSDIATIWQALQGPSKSRQALGGRTSKRKMSLAQKAGIVSPLAIISRVPGAVSTVRANVTQSAVAYDKQVRAEMANRQSAQADQTAQRQRPGGDTSNMAGPSHGGSRGGDPFGGIGNPGTGGRAAAAQAADHALTPIIANLEAKFKAARNKKEKVNIQQQLKALKQMLSLLNHGHGIAGI